MAALFGWLDRDHKGKRVTRQAHRVISSCVKTWRGQVEVFLSKAGDCSVILKNVTSGRLFTIWTGNIDTIWDEPTQKPTVKIEIHDGVPVVVSCPEFVVVEIKIHGQEESHDGPE